jgi:thymidylate synthase (FAD)
MKVELVAITKPVRGNIDDPELLTVEIARVSSNREDKTENPVPLINYLIDHSHWSPFEHAYMTVEIETSRAIGTQILRHRSFTFQELSQRYKDLSKLTIEEMFEIPEFREKGSTNRQGSLEVFDPVLETETNNGIEDIKSSELINRYLTNLQLTYIQLIEANVAPECARMILPLCTKTTIYMTGSIRSWIHFLAQRMDLHAQKEIRLIAYEIWNIFQDQFPIISKALLTDKSKIWNQYETEREEREQGR